MSRFSYLLRGAIGLGLMAFVVSCEDADSLVRGPVNPTGGSLFHSYVALGNSITAGWQSGGLNDSTQQESYAAQFAAQAGTRFAYPSFPRSFSLPGFVIESGCPAPLGNWVSQKLVDSLFATPSGCDLRDPTKATDILNNVGVPYAYAADMTTTGANVVIPGNPLNTLILGGLSQVDRALVADPTFVTFWIGNNETLAPATAGMLGGPATGSPAPPLIPATVETAAMKAALDALVAGAPHLKGGVIFGAVKVLNTPRFFALDSLFTPANKAAFDAFTGKPSTILPNCVPGSGWYVSAEIAPAIFRYPAGPNAHPPLISCGVTGLAPAPVGDVFLLSPTEIAALNSATDAYNTYLEAKADTLGWVYLDPNVLLAAMRTGPNPAVPSFPNFTSNTHDAASAVFGALFSLDGVHPSKAGQTLITNALIDAVNAKYGTSVPKVP